ncbi:FAD-dependent oxidoreductase [Burkholderiaceae bacterium]|nr:FAD-dependent oxidoreductase [Burkholderiaceae bacterium]
MKKALIIGGGAAGCTAAHQLELAGGWDVLLVEAAPYLGAGVRTHWFGGHPYTFGPRHFLTQNKVVYDYMDSICPLRSCEDHQFITYVERDNSFYNYPIHEDDIAQMPDAAKIAEERTVAVGAEKAQNLEEYWVGSVGQTLYDKLIDKYNKKMWLVDDNKKIDTFSWSPKGVTIKSGPRAAWDNAMSAYPYAADGYNKFFDVTTKNTTVMTSTKIEKYDIQNKTVWINGEKKTFDVIVNTISPDLLFEQCFGELKYIGRDLHKIVLPSEYAFPEHVYWLYYANDEKFTRIVEYKKFTHHKSPTTLLGLEIPSLNGRHYPLPFKAEQELARKYYALMPSDVYSIGRAGSYRYGLDIDDCIEQAMIMTGQIKEGGGDYPVPMSLWR